MAEYLKHVDFSDFLSKVSVSNPDLLKREVRYFDEIEANRRDEILKSYFGEEGLGIIVREIVSAIFEEPCPRSAADILDVGCSTGYFTDEIASKIRVEAPLSKIYGLDPSPKSLIKLSSRNQFITPILGVAEDLTGSIDFARRYVHVPDKFDVIYSILTLHHCQDVDKVLEEFSTHLSPRGKALIVDLCKHPFREFREEMGDVHLGFEMSELEEKASRYFGDVSLRRIRGTKCTECDLTGKSVEIFLAKLVGGRENDI